MPISEEDLRYARVLIYDALALTDVLPHRAVEGALGLEKSGEQIEKDLSLANILLSDTASADERVRARADAKGNVHLSNRHKLD
jgi:hypothetical protein